MSKFLEIPIWKKILVLVVGSTILPPTVWIARKVAEGYPEVGDIFMRALTTQGSQPVADVLRSTYLTKIKEFAEDIAEDHEPLSQSWVSEIQGECKVKVFTMWMLLIHHSLDGVIRPIKRSAQQVNPDLEKCEWSKPFDLSLVDGLDITNDEAVLDWLAYEHLKMAFKVNDDHSYYISTGKGRKSYTAKDLLMQWLDNSTDTEAGQLALANRID